MMSIKNREKYKILIITLCAVMTTIALSIVMNLAIVNRKQPENIIISEEKGIYDLSDVTIFDESVIRLVADKTYYPNTYLTPENIESTVSKSVDLYEEIDANYLSQHFVLKLPDNNDTYSMTFILSGRHAMRVYVNGNLAAQTGKLGTTKQDTEVWENNITFNGAAVNGKMDIILNSAQFYHVKRGASLAELRLSENPLATDIFFLDRLKGIGFVGALLCAALLLLSIYFMLSSTKATIYFAIACLVMALREGLQSQAWIYFPISGEISFMLEYLSVVLLTIFLSLYLGQYTRGKFLCGVRYTAIISSIIYGILVLFGDSILYTSLLKYYQIMLVICIVPGIIVLFWQMRHPSREQSTAMFGIGVFYLAAISDICMYSNVFGDRNINVPISEAAMLIFVLAQMISLFQMNSRVLEESKETEKKLETEKTALESLNQLKTEFLGNVSHELKTPLTVMSGYAQSTKQLVEKDNELYAREVSRRMTLISSEAERLSLMVGQILDVTRMEEGRMIMDLAPCNIDEIIHTAIEIHYPILNKNNNRLDIHIESGLPSIQCDSTRISQVIINLISNAVRFTTEGTITISAKKYEDKILICVSDTGVGISSDRLLTIFERYNKKTKSSGSQDTGTGLGLYICKYIVKQHGGKIWIESQEQQGTSVFFTLPIK